MAGPRRPKPRASWQPGQPAAQPAGAAEPAAPAQGAARPAPPPDPRQSYQPPPKQAAPAPAPTAGGVVGPPTGFGGPTPALPPPKLEHAPLSDKDLAGPSTGRGLGRGAPPPAEPVAAAPRDDPPSLSPFQRYAPGAAQLDAASNRTDTTQVLAIVGGLGFMMSAAVVIVAIIGVLGWYTVGNMIEDGRLAGIGPGEDGEDGVGHIRDTATVPDKIIEKPKGGGGKKPGGGDPEPEPVPTGPTTGPGTIIIAQEGVMFHSIEVNCPKSGIRSRANFRSGKATAQGLSTAEECIVTFQGSQPVKTTIRGGQTKTCTSFNPTICR